jgi:hypothetical protein
MVGADEHHILAIPAQPMHVVGVTQWLAVLPAWIPNADLALPAIQGAELPDQAPTFGSSPTCDADRDAAGSKGSGEKR